jgi:hypothetical protein
MLVFASNGCGITVMFGFVPLIVAVETQAVLPVVPPTQMLQLSRNAVPFGVPEQSKHEVSVFPQPQFPAAVLFASVGQASPYVET